VKYVFLLNNDRSAWERWRSMSAEETAAARAQELPKWNALFEWFAEQGIEASGLELEDPADARVVRVRDGQTLVTDGPYVETKELLGGYFLADCKDLDQAIELAQRVPLVDRGSVEIRPLVTH
jgi:hypothetical protein